MIKVLNFTLERFSKCEDCYFESVRKKLYQKGWSNKEIEKIIKLAKEQVPPYNIKIAKCSKCGKIKECYNSQVNQWKIIGVVGYNLN